MGFGVLGVGRGEQAQECSLKSGQLARIGADCSRAAQQVLSKFVWTVIGSIAPRAPQLAPPRPRETASTAGADHLSRAPARRPGTHDRRSSAQA